MQYRTFIQKLKALDLRLIGYKLMHPEKGRGWTYEQPIKVLVGYLMFLSLGYLYPNTRIVPLVKIDLVWHIHVFDTRKYAENYQMQHFGADTIEAANSCKEGKSQ